jgi:purine nucleoside permease
MNSVKIYGGARRRGDAAWAVWWATILLTAPLGAPTIAADLPTRAAPLAVKVMVVNLFGLEAKPWLEALQPTETILVPGLAADYPAVHCNADAVCQMTTGMGHANAAASLMAVLYSGLFDLKRTYFVIGGIAGIDPLRGTIGSAAWARYVVDSGIAHEIDARELPRGWTDGYFGVMTDSPDAVSPRRGVAAKGPCAFAGSGTRGQRGRAGLSAALSARAGRCAAAGHSVRHAVRRHVVDR